jgi:hypothetical protein
MSDKNRGDAGGGGNLPIIESADITATATITSVFSDVAGANMAQISTHQLTLVLPYACDVLLHWQGSCVATTGIAEMIAGYQIDAATPVPILYTNVTSRQYVHWRTLVSLAAGTYVIKAMASRLTNNIFATYGANSAKIRLIAEAYPTS